MADPRQLRFQLKLMDGMGNVHAVVVRELPREAAFMGERIADDVRAGPIGGFTSMDDVVKVLKVKELRRSLLKEAGAMAGEQLADFLQDREGWHGLDRQEQTKKIVSENS